jgi:hypothetical protein
VNYAIMFSTPPFVGDVGDTAASPRAMARARHTFDLLFVGLREGAIMITCRSSPAVRRQVVLKIRQLDQ